MMFVSRMLMLSAITIAVHSYHASLHKHVIARRAVTTMRPTLLQMTDGTESDEAGVMYFDEESQKSPLERFLSALEESIRDETMLKLTLSENDTSTNSEEEDENAAELTASDYDWEFIKELASISGRLIKKKTESKMQLTFYKDKSMKKGDRTVLYSPLDAPSAISNYITKSFKKAMLSTKYSDFEIKMRKGQGKFRETSKNLEHIDVESVAAEEIGSKNDPVTLRRILEDRRLLLLSDPSNQKYKILYAEAKQICK